jgi:hypothetical protein
LRAFLFVFSQWDNREKSGYPFIKRNLNFFISKRTMKKQIIAAFALAAVIPQLHAADLRDQMSIKVGKAVLVMPAGEPAHVAEQVKEALTQFSIPTNLSFQSIPNPLPKRPGSPVAKSVVIQGTPATDYDCVGAYAEITKMPPAVQNALYFNREALRACLYAFEGGVKVEMSFVVMRKTDSLTGGLFNGITSAIRGSDGERISKQLMTNIEDIKKVLPNTLIARVEAPGVPVSEPDKEAVAKLIPPMSAEEATAMAQTKPQISPAVPAQAPAQNVSNTVSGGVDLSVVGARKELSSMGFKFFDQDQFVDAARRDDFLTVRLFLAAAGIRPSSPDSKGETALSFAKDKSEMKMFLSMFVQAEKEGLYPGKVGEAILSK